MHMTTQRTSTHNAVLMSVLFSAGILGSCAHNDNHTFQSIRDYIETIKVVDTHEHQRNRQDPDQGVSFYTLLATTYLRSDLISAGSPPLTSESVRANTLDENWETYGPYLELSKNTSYYAQFLSGFQKLYGYEEESFTKPGIARLSARIDENYRDFDEWYATAFKWSNIDVWLVDPYWQPLDIVLDERYSALILDIDHLVWASANGYRLTQQENPVPKTWVEAGLFETNVYEVAAEAGQTIGNLEDYLDYVGVIFDWALGQKVVGIKNSFAYMRSLYYEDVPFGVASPLFDKGFSEELTDSEEKTVQPTFLIFTPDPSSPGFFMMNDQSYPFSNLETTAVWSSFGRKGPLILELSRCFRQHLISLAARGRSTFSELRRYAPVAAAMATLSPTFWAEWPGSV